MTVFWRHSISAISFFFLVEKHIEVIQAIRDVDSRADSKRTAETPTGSNQLL